jgi:PAS domain S-box-containing protein
MYSVKAAYTKKQLLGLMGFFLTVAVLTSATYLIGGITHLSDDIGPYATIVTFAVVLPLMLWFDAKVHRIRVLLYSAMHIAMIMVLFFFMGTYNPMMTGWLLLCIVTYLEFGYVGFAASSLVLYAASFVLCFLVPYPGSPGLGQDIFYSMMFCSLLVLSAFVTTKILEMSDRGRRELEKTRRSEMAQLNKMNALLNSIGDAILTLDIDTRVTSQNAAALAFFDTNESLVGRRLAEILTIVDEKTEPIDVAKMVADVTRSVSRDDVVIQNNEQGNMRLAIQMSPIYSDNHRQGVVMVLRDITKQKTLEDEKDEFISVASHELRTPIAVAEASVSNLVIMQEKGLDPEKLKTAATTAHDEIVYLAGVVNDLSTLSRAERGVADTPEPVDMNQLFQDLYTRYNPQAEKKGLHLNLDVKGKLPIVEVSRLYVEEILQNLITNAIKYTQEGSVTLVGELTDQGVKCAVTDTGIGISKSDQKHMFERFWRSEDYRTRETNGTGLGLYVVDKLAAKIKTRIDVESRLNHGSTFSLIVPFKSTAQTTGKRSNITES